MRLLMRVLGSASVWLGNNTGGGPGMGCRRGIFGLLGGLDLEFGLV
jgi:hypothetical protein